ncbi:MAG: histidinol-phosphate transaminase [Acidobacteria bacterium]|nr:histidinol-phosphate transaminase [Acidobacteriota bacterium]
MRPQLRDDLAMMEGYHSAQVDVSVRLNTNESPAPPPPGFVDAVGEAVRSIDWHRYPDRSATALRGAIAARYAQPTERVFVANGSNEVLQCALLAYGGVGRRALVFEPTYALHSHIARVTGTEVISAPRDDDFNLDVDAALEAIDSEHPDVIFLCSPNNPSGTVDPEGLAAAVVERAQRDGALVIVDEAYGQFSPRSAVSLIDDERPLLVTRTFSKTWSMAAARLGYGLGPSWLIEGLEAVVLPYHVDAFKQAAGLAALEYGDEMAARVAAIVEQRGSIANALTELDVHLWPSGANFILFRPISRSGDEVWQRLVDHSILVRNCASWPGLEGCLRVTVGSPAENVAFIEALKEIL